MLQDLELLGVRVRLVLLRAPLCTLRAHMPKAMHKGCYGEEGPSNKGALAKMLLDKGALAKLFLDLGGDAQQYSG